MGINNKWHVNWTHHTYYQQKKNPHPKIVGTLIYYAWSVDPKNMVALVSNSANQTKIDETTIQGIKQLLD